MQSEQSAKAVPTTGSVVATITVDSVEMLSKDLVWQRHKASVLLFCKQRSVMFLQHTQCFVCNDCALSVDFKH